MKIRSELLGILMSNLDVIDVLNSYVLSVYGTH